MTLAELYELAPVLRDQTLLVEVTPIPTVSEVARFNTAVDRYGISALWVFPGGTFARVILLRRRKQQVDLVLEAQIQGFNLGVATTFGLIITILSSLVSLVTKKRMPITIIFGSATVAAYALLLWLESKSTKSHREESDFVSPYEDETSSVLA